VPFFPYAGEKKKEERGTPKRGRGRKGVKEKRERDRFLSTSLENLGRERKEKRGRPMGVPNILPYH